MQGYIYLHGNARYVNENKTQILIDSSQEGYIPKY